MGRYWASNGQGKLSSDEWLTPPWILEKLSPFDLDPCAATERPWPTAAQHFTVEDNGLLQEWSGRTYVNPPYGKGLDKWILKAAEHGNGIAMFPLRSTDTLWFHKAVWEKASGILFVRGRIKFYAPDGTECGPCPHSTIIVAWGQTNADVLNKSGIKGHFIKQAD